MKFGAAEYSLASYVSLISLSLNESTPVPSSKGTLSIGFICEIALSTGLPENSCVNCSIGVPNCDVTSSCPNSSVPVLILKASFM